MISGVNAVTLPAVRADSSSCGAQEVQLLRLRKEDAKADGESLL